MRSFLFAKSSPTAAKPSSPKADAEQASENTPAISPTSKEVREYEHHRQQVKKAAETAKLRVRKLASATKQLSLSQPRAPTSKVRKGLGILVDVADPVEPLPDSGKANEEELQASPERKLEVNLGDLIVTRKSPSRKGAENDFELIPHIRSVIILDDNQPHDIDVEEPWEHITGVEDDQGYKDNAKGISYAMVVARAM